MRQHGNIDYANIWVGSLTWLKRKIRTTIVQTNSMTSLIPTAIGISALSSGLNSNTCLLRLVEF